MGLQGLVWFQLEWDDRSPPLPIVVKELVPIVLAWGREWGGRLVRAHCDNQAVVASLTSRNPHCLHLLRALAFIEARHMFYLQPLYINTKLNHLADDLSRNALSSFLLKVPEASREPDYPSVPLNTLLLDTRTDWTSLYWLHLFADIFRKVSPPSRADPMNQR